MLTCAHVAGAALDMLGHEYGQAVGQSIRVAFAQASQPEKLTAEVIDLRYQDAAGRDDVAILRLLSNRTLQKYKNQDLKRFVEEKSVALSSFGYPDGDALGRNVTAITSGPVKAWHQIEVPQDIGTSIREGFSGAPVWSEQGCVGMVVARDDRRPEDRVAFMIPAEQLCGPLRRVQREMLGDILGPFERDLAGEIAAIYRLCRNENATRSKKKGLSDILQDLEKMAAGPAGQTETTMLAD